MTKTDNSSGTPGFMRLVRSLRSMAGCLALLALAWLCGCQKALPEPFEKNGSWGYRLKDGTVRIKPVYLVAQEFSEGGVAFAADAAGWVCLDAGGTVLLRPLLFDNGPDYFSEGLARFTADGRVGFYDSKCRVVVPAIYDFALPFEDGASEVCMGCKAVSAGEHKAVSGGKWWAIDANGKTLVKPEQPGPAAAGKAVSPAPQ
ncbi:MAG: WG repeat-containing protein [Elusimicrobiota bacterium]|nr:WG repeat-containing protein [Elusimicrobiota bacterium]